ncbi:hypothetical protein [Breoghania sp.]|uniref:hypothetical protein n=1 Tax=Breoghania sp. TaxID=2065378 RepID=UPI002604BD7B|nr:hypothetical protein [Breoghania sp.]MDJ0929788.1 hypothetical protein [Breoghania sp.]
MVRFVPSQRLNSILVISARPRYLDQAQKWVERLDRIAGGTKRQLFIYSIQNRAAGELAMLLANILTDPNSKKNANATGGATGETSAATNARVGGLPGSRHRTHEHRHVQLCDKYGTILQFRINGRFRAYSGDARQLHGKRPCG